MKREKRISKGMRVNLWLIIIGVTMIMFIALGMIDEKPGVAYALCAGDLIYLILSILHYEYVDKLVENEMINAGFEQSQIQKNMLKNLPIPYVLTDAVGNILWYNHMFEDMVSTKVGKKNISQLFSALHKKNLPHPGSEKVIEILYDEKRYEVQCRNVKILKEKEEDEDIEVEDAEPIEEENMIAFFFFDMTQLVEYREEFEKKRLVTGLIYIDNYEEVLDNMEEVRQSLLLALVERKIVRYVQSMDAIIKRFERDKFIFVCQEKNLEQMLSDKFSILDEVRAISIGNDLSMTLSISIGVNAPTYMETYESARTAMDMALGRGGDQAVVKNGDSISYYGGKTQKVEKSTRVKARVKAHALRETMLSHDTILIMGHKNPDADCIGAALGIYRLAKTFGKKAYIVMDKDCPAIEPIVSQLDKLPEEEEDNKLFLTNEEALIMKENNSMLVIVDVNVPNMTESPNLLKMIKTIVVLDHHRQANETIKNAVLSYVEPYASSSCEMVAEILQYIADKPKLRTIEADALYSGILVDTDNYVIKAGVRTFEAAAFLRRMGADVTRVRKMFREDREHYMVRADIIHHAEVFMDEFAIATFDPGELSGATIVGAKAANELLNIQGIRGSFVLTKMPDHVYISARSIDDLNVQVIMEQLGGGGHLTMAAAQITDLTVADVKNVLQKLLIRMKEEGDI